MSQSDFIDALGGNRAVATLVSTTPGAVANWRLRKTIPWKFRPALARVAAERAITLPSDFWEGVAA